MLLNLDIVKNLNTCAGGLRWYTINEQKTVEKTIKTLLASDECEKYTWSNWLLTHVFTKEQNVKYAIFAAKEVLYIFEKKYPNDWRPRKAIEAAEKYLNAADAAWDAQAAAQAAAGAAARDAAGDAWYAAQAAAGAAARDAAQDAAGAAARDAARAAWYAAEAAAEAARDAAGAERAAWYAAGAAWYAAWYAAQAAAEAARDAAGAAAEAAAEAARDAAGAAWYAAGAAAGAELFVKILLYGLELLK